MKFYAVHLAEDQRGVYKSWSDTLHRVRYKSHAKFKSFKDLSRARYFANHGTHMPFRKTCLSKYAKDFKNDSCQWKKVAY